MNKAASTTLIVSGSLVTLAGITLLIDKYANEGKLLAKLKGKSAEDIDIDDSQEVVESTETSDSKPTSPPKVRPRPSEPLTLVDTPNGGVILAPQPPSLDYPITDIKKAPNGTYEITVPKRNNIHRGKVSHIRIQKLHPLLDGKQRVIKDNTSPNSKLHKLVVKPKSIGGGLLGPSKKSELNSRIRINKRRLLDKSYLVILKR